MHSAAGSPRNRRYCHRPIATAQAGALHGVDMESFASTSQYCPPPQPGPRPLGRQRRWAMARVTMATKACAPAPPSPAQPAVPTAMHVLPQATRLPIPTCTAHRGVPPRPAVHLRHLGHQRSAQPAVRPAVAADPMPVPLGPVPVPVTVTAVPPHRPHPHAPAVLRGQQRAGVAHWHAVGMGVGVPAAGSAVPAHDARDGHAARPREHALLQVVIAGWPHVAANNANHGTRGQRGCSHKRRNVTAVSQRALGRGALAVGIEQKYLK